MATLNPRLSVTLKPSTAALLDRMSELTEQSRSSIVSEILESSEPVFERMVEVLAAAKLVKSDLKEGTKKRLEEAESQLHEQLGITMDIFDNASRPILDASEDINRRARKGRAASSRHALADEPKRREPPELPPYVTRGSGTPNKSKSKAKSTMKKGSVEALLKKPVLKPSKQAVTPLKRKVKG